MTYGELKRRVLMLIDQYSVAGNILSGAYNNQQDYLNKIPAYANDAIMEIATTARLIPAVLDLAELEYDTAGTVEPEKAAERIYTLPADFYRFRTGETLVTTEDGEILHTNRYLLMGKKCLAVPRAEIEDGKCYRIGYYRYPTLLGVSPLDSAELDNEPETHDAVAFYVAAHLAMRDDSFLYSALYNKYEDKLDKMGPGVSVEFRDASGEGCCGVCNYGVYVC